MTFSMTAKEFEELTGIKAGKAPKRLKYRNVKTTTNDGVFDSKWEAAVYADLKSRQSIGEIRNLHRQVKFPLIVKGIKVATFIADFTYEERAPYGWLLVIADAKSPMTRKNPAYRIKAKLMAVLYRPIHEIVSAATRHRSRVKL